jgi:NAD(P)H dehydrogenase (quinone)
VTVKAAVIHYSSTGTVHALAEAVAEGAASGGAEVRLRRVAELAPDSAIDQNPQWRQHADAVASIAEAPLEDLAWADAFAFGTPTRFGAPAVQLKQFMDQAGGLWQARKGAGRQARDRLHCRAHPARPKRVHDLVPVQRSSSMGVADRSARLRRPDRVPRRRKPLRRVVRDQLGERRRPRYPKLDAARYQGRCLAEITIRLVGTRPADSTACDGNTHATMTDTTTQTARAAG